MSYVNRVVALVLGVALFPVCAYVIGSLPNPVNYAKDYPLVPIDVLDGLTPAVPLVVLSLVLSWIALRWLARQPRIAVGWCFAGLIIGFMCWEVVSAVQDYYGCLDWYLDYKRRYYAPHPGVWMSPPQALPACSVLGNLYSNLHYGWWWIGPPFLAVLAGLAAAVSIVLKSERITARAVPA